MPLNIPTGTSTSGRHAPITTGDCTIAETRKLTARATPRRALRRARAWRHSDGAGRVSVQRIRAAIHQEASKRIKRKLTPASQIATALRSHGDCFAAGTAVWSATGRVAATLGTDRGTRALRSVAIAGVPSDGRSTRQVTTGAAIIAASATQATKY